MVDPGMTRSRTSRNSSNESSGSRTGNGGGSVGALLGQGCFTYPMIGFVTMEAASQRVSRNDCGTASPLNLEVMQHGDHRHHVEGTGDLGPASTDDRYVGQSGATPCRLIPHGGVGVVADDPLHVWRETGEQFAMATANVQNCTARLREVRDDPAVEVVVVTPRMTRVDLLHPSCEDSSTEGGRPPPHHHEEMVKIRLGWQPGTGNAARSATPASRPACGRPSRTVAAATRSSTVLIKLAASEVACGTPPCGL
jgi:hypothetical protein